MAENEQGVQAAWDDLNRVALEKLRFYVTTRVDDIVTNGDKLTAREYYERLEGLFLQTGSESIASRVAQKASSMQIYTRRGDFRVDSEIRCNIHAIQSSRERGGRR